MTDLVILKDISDFSVQILILIFADIQTNRWSCGGQTGAMNIDHHNFSLPLLLIQEPASSLPHFLREVTKCKRPQEHNLKQKSIIMFFWGGGGGGCPFFFFVFSKTFLI